MGSGSIYVAGGQGWWESGAHPLSLRLEQKDFDEIGCHEFPWTLVLDREELDKFWLSVVLPIADPLVAVPIGLEF